MLHFLLFRSILFLNDQNLGFRLAYLKNRENGNLASNNFQQSTFCPNLSPVTKVKIVAVTVRKKRFEKGAR